MAGMVTETRVLDDGMRTYRDKYNGGPLTERRSQFFPACTQTTTSFRTRGGQDDDPELWSTVTRNGLTTTDPKFDRGHPFFTTKTSVKTTRPNWNGWWPGVDYVGSNVYSNYSGPLIVAAENAGQPVFPAIRQLSTSEIKNFGSRAISSCSPTAPAANLAVALGEIVNDGSLPKYPGEALLGAKKPERGFAGEEFLNYQFGISPLLGDIKKLVLSLSKRTETLRQLSRDSGKTVRRGFKFPVEHSILADEYSYQNTSTSAFMLVDGNLLKSRNIHDGWGARHVTRTKEFERTIWFRGAFTYYIADNTSLWSRMERYEQQAQKLLGTRFNPSAAWQLAPWSWLIDWQADIGTVLSASSQLSEDGLVMRYGYLMSHTRDRIVLTADSATFKGGADLLPVSTIYARESKERVQATPFGFGLDLQKLSASQWAILAALGMTKGDRRMR